MPHTHTHLRNQLPERLVRDVTRALQAGMRPGWTADYLAQELLALHIHATQAQIVSYVDTILRELEGQVND